jgi:hypothetical protein
MSGALVLTRDGDLVGGSTVRTDNTARYVLHSKDYVLKLTASLAEAAGNAQIKALKDQTKELTAILSGLLTQQVPPTSSKVFYPIDHMEGEALQGT